MQNLSFKRISIWLVFLFAPYYSESQTKYLEEIVFTHYFNVFIKDINSHLENVFDQTEKKIFSQVKVKLDSTGENNYNINSNSKTRTITFSSNLINGIVRYCVADVITNDSVYFDRKRFSSFYVSIYSYLSNNIYPEDAAELSLDQRKLLKNIVDTDEFSWTIKSKILFLYLHELAHQFQNYSLEVDKIDASKISAAKKDSLLLDLEMKADMFAVDKIFALGFEAYDFIDALTYFAFVREKKFTTIEEIVFREFNIYQFCIWGLKCEESNEPFCRYLRKRALDFEKLYDYYVNLHSLSNLNGMKLKAKVEKDINTLYNLGDFYLKGTSHLEANLDSALYYYEQASNLKESDGLFGATSKFQFQSIKEYCAWLGGKIFQVKLNSLNKAIEYFNIASKIAIMFPKSYYEALLQNVKKSNSK